MAHHTTPRRLLSRTFPHSLLLVAFAGVGSSQAASLQEVTGFGTNPSNIKMFVYVPDKVQAHPPVVVGLHWCHGTAQAFYSGTGFAGLADKYGFILVYPNANSSDSCWDVHSTAALTHNGGSDPQGIVSMVRWVVKNKGADSTRVYVSGHSSGGMMTNVMVGSYPEIFQAGSAFAGVPFSCFAGGTSSWNSSCAGGTVTKTGAAWGDAVRAAYPGYNGSRPRLQVWHGDQDGTLSFKNFAEEIKEWTNVLAVPETPLSTEQNAIQSGWIRTRYGASATQVKVEAIQETGQPHNLKIMADQAVTFFGLDAAATSVVDGALTREVPRLQAFTTGSRAPVRVRLDSPPGQMSLEIRDLSGRIAGSLVRLESNGVLETSLDLTQTGTPSGGRVLRAMVQGREIARCLFVIP